LTAKGGAPGKWTRKGQEIIEKINHTDPKDSGSGLHAGKKKRVLKRGEKGEVRSYLSTWGKDRANTPKHNVWGQVKVQDPSRFTIEGG